MHNPVMLNPEKNTPKNKDVALMKESEANKTVNPLKTRP